MAKADTPLDFDVQKHQALSDCPNKVRLKDLGRPEPGIGLLEDLLEGLPGVPGGSAQATRDVIVTAHGSSRLVLVALAGHVIKMGCGPHRMTGSRGES